MSRELDDSHRSSSLDDQIWKSLSEPVFQHNSALAEVAASLWHHLIEEIDGGPEGSRRARESLEKALNLTFLFTKVSRTCRELFELSLARDLAPENQPLFVLTAALERAKREVECGR